MSEPISRRDFLKLASVGAATTAVLTGCGPASQIAACRERFVSFRNCSRSSAVGILLPTGGISPAVTRVTIFPHRLGSAFKSIRAGERVIDAQLDAGFESPSGFRDAFARIMGAPPAHRAARALFAAWLDTPLGPMTAIADEHALHLLEFVDRRGLEREIERLRLRQKAGIAPGRTAPIEQIEEELADYFAGRSMLFKTPLARAGSPFQNAVWDALLTIPPGETRSYAQLARTVGRPQAVRAAGTANGANQLAIVIPCHRVINTSGELGGYAGGLPRKRHLRFVNKSIGDELFLRRVPR